MQLPGVERLSARYCEGQPAHLRAPPHGLLAGGSREARAKAICSADHRDVGCGYGDALRTIHRWGARHGVALSLTGIDWNGDAIRAAHDATPAGTGICWVHGDASSHTPALGIDIAISSLLTHHLEAPEIVRFLGWMEERSRLGWFVNDLHRMDLPYRAFGWLTRLVPLHPFVQYDGGISIRRSFRLEDWQRLCVSGGLSLDQVSIREYWPARLCVGRIKA